MYAYFYAAAGASCIVDSLEGDIIYVCSVQILHL